MEQARSYSAGSAEHKRLSGAYTTAFTVHVAARNEASASFHDRAVSIEILLVKSSLARNAFHAGFHARVVRAIGHPIAEKHCIEISDDISDLLTVVRT